MDTGSWISRPRASAVWVEGHWERTTRGWGLDIRSLAVRNLTLHRIDFAAGEIDSFDVAAKALVFARLASTTNRVARDRCSWVARPAA